METNIDKYVMNTYLVLGFAHVRPHLTVILYHPHLWMRRLKHRESKSPAQDSGSLALEF